jgi:hypothetical protein
MATQPVDITDTGGVNFAGVTTAALVQADYGLVVRAIISPANNLFSALQLTNIGGPGNTFRVSNGGASSNRRFVRVKNGSAYNLFLFGVNPVDLTKAYLLMPGEVETFEMGPNLTIWGLSDDLVATGPIYVLELG